MDSPIILEDLFLTVHTGDFKGLKTLLSRDGAPAPVEDLDLRDAEGSTPLICCVKGAGTRIDEPNEQHLECCRLLVSAEALLDAVDHYGKSALHWCVSYEVLDILAELLNLGARLDVVDSDGNNPLHFAILRGSVKSVEVICELSSPQILETEDPHGRTPLMHAAMDGKYDICHLLLQGGVNANAVSSFASAKAAIHFAARLENVSTMDMLIKYGADLKVVDSCGASVYHHAACSKRSLCLSLLTGLCGCECLVQSDIDGKNVLMYACESGNLEPVEFLLNHKVPVTSVDNEGKTCLHYCAPNPTSDIIKLLCNVEPTLVSFQDKLSHTALHEAISEGNLVAVRSLLEMDSDITMTDSELHSPVHWATVFGHADCIKVLAKYGAKVNMQDIYGACPLHYAAELYGLNQQHDDTSSKTLKALLDCGVDRQCTDSDGRQPIHWAASAGNSLACKLLVDAGVCVDTTCNDGLTALHLSSSCGHSSCIGSLLLDCNANSDSLDDNGCTPLFYAITMGHVECAEVLLQFGCSPNVQDKDGKSPAHFAASQGQLQCMELLLQYGGCLELLTNQGESPLHEAIYNLQIDIVKFLIEHGCSIDVRNEVGVRPIHAAVSTANEELCLCLIEAKADLNAVLVTPEGKYVTAYDLAQMKQSSNCSNLLQQNGAAKGKNIANLAASKIQGSWRKHRSKSTLKNDSQSDRLITEDNGLIEDDATVDSEFFGEDSQQDAEEVPGFHNGNEDFKTQDDPANLCNSARNKVTGGNISKISYSNITKVSKLESNGSWSIHYDKNKKKNKSKKEEKLKASERRKTEEWKNKHEEYWTLKCPKLRDSEEYKQLREKIRDQYRVNGSSKTAHPALRKFYKTKEAEGIKALDDLERQAILVEERIERVVQEQQSVIDHFRKRHENLKATIKQTSEDMDRNIMLAKQFLGTDGREKIK